jgi:biopolymer transport protein ExbB/TolQ
VLLALQKAWTWTKAYWPVVLAVVGGVVGLLLGGAFVKELRRPDKAVNRELNAAKEGELAARVAVDHGTEHAVKMVEEQHAETIATLEGAQKAKYEALRSDPRALATHLSRLSDKG